MTTVDDALAGPFAFISIAVKNTEISAGMRSAASTFFRYYLSRSYFLPMTYTVSLRLGVLTNGCVQICVSSCEHHADKIH